MISEKALKEFKEIWKVEFGEEISDELALENAIALLTLTDISYRPVKKMWLEGIVPNEVLYKRYTSEK